MSREAANAAFHVLNQDRKPIPGIKPFLKEMEREMADPGGDYLDKDEVDEQAEQVVTNHQPSALEIQNLLTSRDAVLPESFQTVSIPEPRAPLSKDEAIKYGLIHSGNNFLTHLGYAYAAGNEDQRMAFRIYYCIEVFNAENEGQRLWQQG